MRIYELNNAWQEIIHRMEEGDELDLTDTLESIEEALEVKLENTAKVIRTIEAEAAAIKTEEERLKKRRNAMENNVSRLKHYIFESMQITGKERLKGVHVSLRLQNNPPSVNMLDDKAIPAHYLIEQPSTVDKKAVLQDLKDGIAVEGAELKQEKSLRIV